MGQSSIVHNFEERLAWGESAIDEQFWLDVYQRAFPTMVNMMPCPGDHASQRMGIDRLILLSSGQVLRIDEKKRATDYDDILLEYLSNDVTGAPGWIEKNLYIDYLAYAFSVKRICYLLPWLMLRKAWIENGEIWRQRYRPIIAHNETYSTHSIAVPINVLYRAVDRATRIELPDAGRH